MPTWTIALAVGHQAIDDQHRELFARADDLIAAMIKRRALAETRPLMGFLRAYCLEHFSLEERLMQTARYPGAVAHGRMHREFERRFAEIEGHMSAHGPTAVVVLDIKDLIRGWLVQHIGTVDVKLASYLNREAPRPGGEPSGAS